MEAAEENNVLYWFIAPLLMSCYVHEFWGTKVAWISAPAQRSPGSAGEEGTGLFRCTLPTDPQHSDSFLSQNSGEVSNLLRDGAGGHYWSSVHWRRFWSTGRPFLTTCQVQSWALSSTPGAWPPSSSPSTSIHLWNVSVCLSHVWHRARPCHHWSRRATSSGPLGNLWLLQTRSERWLLPGLWIHLRNLNQTFKYLANYCYWGKKSGNWDSGQKKKKNPKQKTPQGLIATMIVALFPE